MLVAEEDHQILGERAMDFVERAVAERLRQVDPGDLAADDRRQLVDGDRIVRRLLVGDVLVTGPWFERMGSIVLSLYGRARTYARVLAR
jgi:hypothetical protein